MIINLLKQAIKENNIEPVREAFKLLTGKDYIVNGQTLEIRPIPTKNKFDPNDYKDVPKDDLTYATPTRRSRPPSKMVRTCSMCTTPVQQGERICNECSKRPI